VIEGQGWVYFSYFSFLGCSWAVFQPIKADRACTVQLQTLVRGARPPAWWRDPLGVTGVNSQGEQPKPERYRRIRNVLRTVLGRTHDAVMVVNEGPGEHRHEATGLMANCVKVGLGRSRSPALGNQGHPSIR